MSQSHTGHRFWYHNSIPAHKLNSKRHNFSSYSGQQTAKHFKLKSLPFSKVFFFTLIQTTIRMPAMWSTQNITCNLRWLFSHWTMAKVTFTLMWTAVALPRREFFQPLGTVEQSSVIVLVTHVSVKFWARASIQSTFNRVRRMYSTEKRLTRTTPLGAPEHFQFEWVL